MAIKGDLFLSRTPGGEMENFAGIDCNVGLEGIWAKGHLNEFKVGPLVWNDAMIDLQLIPLQSHFLLNGEVELLGSMKMIDLAITRDSLAFKTATEIDGLYSSMLTASGAFNLTNPDFAVHGELQNDFSETLEVPLSQGLSVASEAGIITVNAAMVAFEQADKLRQKKEQAVDQLKIELEKVRNTARQIMVDAKSERDVIYNELVSSKNSKNAAFNKFKNIKSRFVKEKAAALKTYKSKLAAYGKKAAQYTKIHAVYVGKLAIYNAIPDPDNNPKLVALKDQADKMWEKFQLEKEKLNNLRLFSRRLLITLRFMGNHR